ncbi:MULTISPECIES: HEPN domain-containing protein [Pectobacterium]|uniref:Uncharacterized protein n=1 Tax=Pectobacterium carotovorum subsp. carotovorum (strain PC1) TaxID=561230 RepID=C6DE38_PECCP|nr:HEPN domain-containing protein [Pectobacterium carotovorum]ACT14474.1 hypothetical protein PC1_3458 [Pectobacterium carotovorum subsp. carotovorum PC1]
MYDGGFYVISTNATFPKEILPFDISDKYRITNPNEFEIEIFERNLKDAGYFSRMFVPFGSDKKIIEEDGKIHAKWEHATVHDIYILKFSDFNRNRDEIKYAASLLNPKLRFTMHTIYSDETESSSNIQGLSTYSDLSLMVLGSHEDRVEYSHEQLLELRMLFATIKNLNIESRYRGILQLFKGTDNISWQSNLLTLSYFSILEALLTNGRNNGESITNQLVYKTRLLLNMSGVANHQLYFSEINYDALWKKLYKLRSHIAHGNNFSFQKDLSSLKDITTVNNYLDSVVQKLIKFSLNNQQLVDDLKLC